MNTALIFLLVGAILFALVLKMHWKSTSKGGPTLHGGSLYIVLSWTHFFVLTILVLSSFFIIGGMIGTGFREPGYYIGFLLVSLGWTWLLRPLWNKKRA